MHIIKSHDEHIKDIKNSIEREKSRLNYLLRCESGEQKWNLSKKELVSEIGFQRGKISGLSECLEMAKAFSKN